jgi:hypothetical protein
VITGNASLNRPTTLSALSSDPPPLPPTLTHGDKGSPFIAQAINIPLSRFLAQLNN